MADLYFWTSKIAWFFLEPLHAIIAMTGLTWIGYRRLGYLGRRFAISLISIGWFGLGALPVWHALLAPWETRIPRPEPLPASIAGIIVLGGAIEPGSIHALHGAVALNGAAERMTETLTLMHRYPKVPVVFSGYSGQLGPTGASEAQMAVQFFAESWGSAERILLEDASRNTLENARFTEALVGGRATAPWLLVTSAFHMPRAVAIFNDTTLEVIPFPVDYRSMAVEDAWRFNLLDGAELATLLVHEWLGLLVYQVFQSD